MTKLTLKDLGTGTPKGYSYWRNANTCQKRIWLEEKYGRPEILKPSAAVGTVLHALLGKYHGGSFSPFAEYDDADIIRTLEEFGADGPKLTAKALGTFNRYKAIVAPDEWGEVQAIERQIPKPETGEADLLQKTGWYDATGAMDLLTYVDSNCTENLASKWGLYLQHGLHQWDFKTWESALFKRDLPTSTQTGFYKHLASATGLNIAASHLIAICRWETEGKSKNPTFPVEIIDTEKLDYETTQASVQRGHKLLEMFPGQANPFACSKGFDGWPCDFRFDCDRRSE